MAEYTTALVTPNGVMEQTTDDPTVAAVQAAIFQGYAPLLRGVVVSGTTGEG